VSFTVEGIVWDINDTVIIGTYSMSSIDTPLMPVIVLPPGARINPPASEAQYFFTEQGIKYTVTSEDGLATKTYTAKATATDMLIKYEMKDWVVLPRHGSSTWFAEGFGAQTLWNGGHPMLAIDDDPESGWHSIVTDPVPPFPQVLVVDMKAPRRVSRITGTGNYFKNVQLYLTNDLSMPSNYYYSLDVVWDDDTWRKFDYNFWLEQMIEMMPDDLPAASWGRPIAQTMVEDGMSFSFLLPQTLEGQFLIFLFPDNNMNVNEPTYIAVFDIGVYHD
jgi:hypothetical protein